MAHTKAKGTTKLGRDSESKRLGVKIFGGSPVRCGQIIIRQRGTRYMAGEGTKIGKDDTLYAIRDGVVIFRKTKYTNFTGNRKMKQFVSVAPATETKSKAKNEMLKEDAKGETLKTENFNPKEAEEAAKRKDKGQIIREEELPRIPMRKDVKKAKSPVKHSHKK